MFNRDKSQEKILLR